MNAFMQVKEFSSNRGILFVVETCPKPIWWKKMVGVHHDEVIVWKYYNVCMKIRLIYKKSLPRQYKIR